MVINGKEIKFSISSRRDAANFELALKGMEKKEKKIKEMKNTSLTEMWDAVTEMFRDFFKTATGINVIGECDDVNEMREMYMLFLTEVGNQKQAFLAPFSAGRIK